MEVRLDRVRKVYGGVVAVDDVSLTIGNGEFVTLLGASGSGKTTCLRMVAGFVVPSSGRVLIGTEDVTRRPPHRRNTAMVFQQYALFPHLSVADNIGFGLKVRRLGREEITRRVRDVLKLVQLEAFAERMPSQLSGGQRQRVALGRAVVVNPEILLLDEPLGALDLKLREELQLEIKRVQQTLGITTLFVTHDQGEALSMSDRVAVMHLGRIIQVDTPSRLYTAPANEIVARFIGRITLWSVRVESIENGCCFVIGDDGARFRTRHWPNGSAPGTRLLLAIRPEAFQLAERGENERRVVVDRVVYQGSKYLLHCIDPTGVACIAEVPLGAATPSAGSVINLSWSAEDCRAITPAPLTTA
jgi:putative spermidine/putrescine transport system ATP-binding protein